MPLPPKTWVEVRSAALRHNAASLQKMLAPGSALMAVVKSNAYGHGTAQAVGALKGHVGWFGVDSVLEADIVHKANPAAKILVLGLSLPAWIPHAASRGYRLSVSSLSAARVAAATKRPLTVHLELETGLTRQGIDRTELDAVLRLLSKNHRIHVEGVFMHFANIDDGGLKHPYAKLQLKRFVETRADIEQRLGSRITIGHAACSAPSILFPSTHFQLVRAGISIYGYWSSRETAVRARHSRPGFELRPALSWKTIVAQVKTVKKGTPVGYGLSERMPRTGRVAVLPIGYWDGYDRGLASQGRVVIRGKLFQIIGRICMNMCMVDVTRLPSVQAGDEVIVLGGRGKHIISAELLARQLNTNTYEVMTRINPQLPRILV